jgi:hypothetical protein
MQRFGIEEESWFEAARTGLERRGFRLRIQPRAIILDKEGRLPRMACGAREFLEFAERQGVQVDPVAFEAADRYGDARSDLSGRFSASPFETPPLQAAGAPRFAWAAGGLTPARQPEANGLDARLGELRLEQDRLAQERREAHTLLFEKRRLEERCAGLQADALRLTAAAEDAIRQRDVWQLSAASAEQRLRALEADLDRPAPTAVDQRFEQLRRFLARELHPDLAGGDAAQRALREALFKRVWAKIEQLK